MSDQNGDGEQNKKIVEAIGSLKIIYSCGCTLNGRLLTLCHHHSQTVIVKAAGLERPFVEMFAEKEVR